MRVVTLVLAVMLLAGCGRWVGIGAARREVFSDALKEQRFPMNAEMAAQRLGDQLGITSRRQRLSNGEVRWGGCLHNRCFQLLEEHGLTRIATTDTFSEKDLVSLWQPLDPASLSQLRLELDVRVEDKLTEQESAFVPRWGITLGALAGVTTEVSASGSVGLGARLGVRRWFDVHFIGHTAVEYRFRGEHELSFRAGFEVARWTDGRLWGFLGAPPASVSFFMGPLFRLQAFRWGLRTGVGIHVTDLSSAPFFFEVAAETTFAGESSRVVGTFTIGVGI